MTIPKLRRRVAGARSRLAKLEVEFTTEKSRLDVVQAALFRRLRGHYQRRAWLRLAIHFRQKFLDSFVRDNTDEVEQAENDLRQAKAQLERDYTEQAAAAEKRKPLTAAEKAELPRHWTKLVKLLHPDRFARAPETLETYHRLTAVINQARDGGDIATLCEIAKDPQGFILRQGWENLDFTEEKGAAQLKRLHKGLQNEIAAVRESLRQLRRSPYYKLCQSAEQKPNTLEQQATERAKQFEVENAELELQAERLAQEIRKVSGRTTE